MFLENCRPFTFPRNVRSASCFSHLFDGVVKVPPLRCGGVGGKKLPVVLVRCLLRPKHYNVNVTGLTARLRRLTLRLFSFANVDKKVMSIVIFIKINRRIMRLPQQHSKDLVQSNHVRQVTMRRRRFMTVITSTRINKASLIIHPMTVMRKLPPITQDLTLRVITRTTTFTTQQNIRPNVINRHDDGVGVRSSIKVTHPNQSLLQMTSGGQRTGQLLMRRTLIRGTVLTRRVALIKSVSCSHVLKRPLFVRRARRTASVIVSNHSTARMITGRLLVSFPTHVFLIRSFCKRERFQVLTPPKVQIFQNSPPSTNRVFRQLSKRHAPKFFQPRLRRIYQFKRHSSIVGVFRPFKRVPQFIHHLRVTARRRKSILVTQASPPSHLINRRINQRTLLRLTTFPFVVICPTLHNLRGQIPVFPLIVRGQGNIRAQQLHLRVPFTRGNDLVPSLLRTFHGVIRDQVRPIFGHVSPIVVTVNTYRSDHTTKRKSQIHTGTIIGRTPLNHRTTSVLILRMFTRCSSVSSPHLQNVVIKGSRGSIQTSEIHFQLFIYRHEENEHRGTNHSS